MHLLTSLFFPPFYLDLASERLWQEEQAIILRAKTFAVLRLLVTRPGELVTKETLLNAIWPNTSVSEGAIKICIQELRKALQDDTRTPSYIETVHRRGYRFIAPVSTGPTPVPSFKLQVPTALHSLSLAPKGEAYQEAIRHLSRGLELLAALPDTPERARQELELRVALGFAFMAMRREENIAEM